MINRYEYKLLRCIQKGKIIKTQKYMSQLHSLVDSGFVELTFPTSTGIFSITYHGCRITNLGLRAFEEYRRHKISVALTIVGIVVAIAAIIVPILVTQISPK